LSPLYEIWRFFSPPAPSLTTFLRIAFLLLSISFVSASLLAARYYNAFVRLFYSASSVWLGTLKFPVHGVGCLLARVCGFSFVGRAHHWGGASVRAVWVRFLGQHLWNGKRFVDPRSSQSPLLSPLV
jgi:hypothetical protein